MPTAPPSARTLRPALLALAAALLAALVYANAPGNGFALDDRLILEDNRVVHGLGDLRGLLLAPYWPRSDEMWRPLTLLSFAVEWEAWGKAPAAFHATNVLLHALVSALVVLLVLRLGGGRGAALLAGALFAVHPLHVEAVSNLVGRGEVLATLFALLALLAALSDRLGTAGRAAAGAGLYLLALLSKESAVAVPALLLLLDALRARDDRSVGLAKVVRRNLPALAAMALVLAAYVLVRTHGVGVRSGTEPVPWFKETGTVERWASAARVVPEYLRLLFWPRHLSAEWGPGLLDPVGWSSPLAWLGVLLTIGLLALAAWAWSRNRWISVAVLWFAGTVFLVTGIPFPVGVMLAERTLYLPSVALAFLAPPLVAAFAKETPPIRRAGVALAAVLLALGALRTWTRTPVWESTETVFDAMRRDDPGLWMVEWRAGELLVRGGRPDLAHRWYRSAMEKVRGAHFVMNIQYATVLLEEGSLPQAEALLRRTLRLHPQTEPAYRLLARTLLAQGRAREAIAAADSAEAVPRFGRGAVFETLHLKSLAYAELGRPDSALALEQRALGVPHARARPWAWYHMARLLHERGETGLAAAALDSARSRAAPELRGRFVLDPPPPVTSPLLRGWGAWVGRPAEAGAARAFPGFEGEGAPR